MDERDFHIPFVENTELPHHTKLDTTKQNNVFNRAKDNTTTGQSKLSSKPYKHFNKMNDNNIFMPMPSTHSIHLNMQAPMSMSMPMSMPMSHSIHLNTSNGNNIMPAITQSRIPINLINPTAQVSSNYYGQPGQFGQSQKYLPMNPYEYPMTATATAARLPFVPLEHMGHQMGYPIGHPLGHAIIINKPTNTKIITSISDIGNIKQIYQDLLPKNETSHDRYATISERLKIADYNSLIFKKYYYKYDGDTIGGTINENIKSDVQENTLMYLLGNIKINSIFTNTKATSHLTTMAATAATADNMIIFNVCNPIQFDGNQKICRQKVDGVESDDGSIQLHLRIYKLISGDDFIHDELYYYDKIKKLIRNKKYPNFVLSYGEFFSNCKIDFDGMINLKDYTYNSRIPISPTGVNCLLMLTEGININIVDWAQKITKEKDLNDPIFITDIISTGFRSKEVWYSVIFQLIVAIYILFTEKINIDFNNFTLKDNVFIKRIKIAPPQIKYWKYIINGAKYYVPNEGWLVMINSNKESTKNISKNTDPLQTPELIKEIIGQLLLELNKSSIPPPNELIDNLVNDLNNNYDIKTILAYNFKNYLYEKIGHIIPETQIQTNEYMRSNNKNFNIGDVVLYELLNGVFSISTILEKDESSGNILILTNEDYENYDDFDKDNINFTNIYVTGDQITKFSYNTTKEVIETYKINYNYEL
jgi:hypothetical protein